MSGLHKETRAETALRNGAFGCIQKPIELDKLQRLVDQIGV